MELEDPKMQRRIRRLVTWFGFGNLPKVPGTWGTLGAIPLVWVFSLMGPWGYMLATFFFVILSIQLCEWYGKQTKSEDPSEVVIDEVAGFLVAMTWIPLTPMAFLIGFLVFRFFDIVKPFPISYFDKKVKGGVGVVADDVVAGIFTNILLQVALSRTQWLEWTF